MRSIPSSQKRATSAVYLALTALVLASAALAVFEQARGRRLVMEISRLGGDPQAPGAEAVFGAVTVFAILIILFAATAIACAAAYLNWLVRARRYADRPAVVPVVASWFVPVINLFAPALLVDRLWWASRPPPDRRERWVALLTAWWLSWLVALALVLVRLWPGASRDGASLTGFGMLELVAVAVAALLCGATVRQIGAVQAAGARHRRQETTGGHLQPPSAGAVAHLGPDPLPQDSPVASASVPPAGAQEAGARGAATRETTAWETTGSGTVSERSPERTPEQVPEHVVERDPERPLEQAQRERAPEVHPAGQ
ncbi:DUF4328 domain-containing protein [Streptosporangium sp. NPDC023615]|uniref:DUF4328 domain-containing protein n=1 Tax=Streptosporangium sp. NPDC023615 TaxID=3154794 RepID=UPI00341421F0